MTERTFNFYSGPATLPTSVLEHARDELLSLNGTGMSVMELSHRSAAFLEILRSAQDRIRALLSIPEHYHVLFLQGGASLQFSMVPMNFLDASASADYLITGAWSRKASGLAAGFGRVNNITAPSADGRLRVPDQDEIYAATNAAYIHYISNETIDGVEFPYDVDGAGVPVVCDASSNILSKAIDIEKYSMIYAGAQKNIGPSGVTLVILKDEFLKSARGKTEGVLNYGSFADNGSMPNTPNTWGVYIINLVCGWLLDQGGIKAAEARNAEKAALIYSAIDNSDGFYTGNVEFSSRSRMNVTFRLPSESLEDEFCTLAESSEMTGLRGHRSVGGIRASVYNAFPMEGIERLVEHMNDFAQRKG